MKCDSERIDSGSESLRVSWRILASAVLSQIYHDIGLARLRITILPKAQSLCNIWIMCLRMMTSSTWRCRSSHFANSWQRAQLGLETHQRSHAWPRLQQKQQENKRILLQSVAGMPRQVGEIHAHQGLRCSRFRVCAYSCIGVCLLDC